MNRKMVKKTSNNKDKFSKVNESELFDDVMFLGEGDEPTDNETSAEEEASSKVTDEQLRVDALKISVKLSRLMNKVTAEDLLEISSKVCDYLKNHQVGNDYEEDDEFDLEDGGDAETLPEDAEELTAEDVEETPETDTEDVDIPEEFDIEDDEESEDVEKDEEEDKDKATDESSASDVIPDEFII